MSLNYAQKVDASIERYLGPAEPELIGVFMDDSDWATVIEALEYLAGFSSTALDATSDELTFIADSIQDVLSSL